MARPRRSRRPRTILLILVLVSVTIVTLDARGSLRSVTSGLRTVAADSMSPVRSLVNAVTRPVGSFLAGSVHYGAVSQQNQKLQAEVGRLRQQVLQQNDAEQRLRQLTALENLPFAGNLQEVACQVIAYNTSDFAATVTIDKGRADGVTIGMPVVGSGGLVGMVVLASHHTATVRLVTDGQSVVGAAYGTAGTPAIVAGQGWGKPLSGQLVPADTRLPRGTLFSTSGLQGAAFPPGIPVARVIRASTGTVASQEIVTLAPVVDLAHLRYDAVLLWGPA